MALSILILLGFLLNNVETAPVDVNVDVWALGAPYSTGYLNCLSAVKLWLLVIPTTFLNLPPSIILDATIKPSTNVAQAE